MRDRDPRRSRESFNRVADLYARYRRGYPPEVIEAVAAAADLGAGSRVLEIGCGTGQLSVPLATLGVHLLAVELGSALAEIARRRLHEFPGAHVEVADFEQWPLPTQAFDAAVCANAFHWLDPGLRITKTAQALRPGGTLVIVHPHHVRGGTLRFCRDDNIT